MSQPYRRPFPWHLRLPLLLGPILAGSCWWFTQGFGRPNADELAGVVPKGEVEALRTSAFEGTAVLETFPETYLVSPVGPPPCPQDLPSVSDSQLTAVRSALRGHGRSLPELHQYYDDGWLAGLLYGHQLIRDGQLDKAREILKELRRRANEEIPWSGGSLPHVLWSAKLGKPEWSSIPRENILAYANLLQALGYANLQLEQFGGLLWYSLREAIGCANLFGLRGPNGKADRTDSWELFSLPAPGCPAEKGGLTTYDLYNNLIVGYLRDRSFRDAQEKQRKEWSRGYTAPPNRNPLLATLRHATSNWEPEREHWVWALSNAERLMHAVSANKRPMPQHPQLSLNLAQLMQSALDMSPQEARESLLDQRDQLTEAAWNAAGGVDPTQAQEHALALTRLDLLRASRRGIEPRIGDSQLRQLTRDQRELAQGMVAALHARREPTSWLQAALGDSDGELRGLGSRLGEWKSASRQDLAIALAKEANRTSGEEAKDRARAARAVLHASDPKPEVVEEAEKAYLGTWERWLGGPSTGGSVAAGALSLALGALGFWGGWWFSFQLRLRREIFTSFYRLEALARLRERQ